MKPFFLFTFYTGLQCLTGALLLLRRAINVGEVDFGISTSVIRTSLMGSTVIIRAIVVRVFIDRSDDKKLFGVWPREAFGYFPLDLEGKEVIPAGFKQDDALFYQLD